MDLILSTLKPEKKGWIHHDALLPIVGTDDSGKLLTAGEVFVKGKFVFMQLRSAIAPGFRRQWVRDLLEWIQDGGKIREIICLASLEADERMDKQIRGTGLRYLFTKPIQDDETDFKLLGWQMLEKKVEEDGDLFIPGGGFSKELFIRCKENDMPLTILFTFASEGDNVGDAMKLLEYYNQWRKQFEYIQTPQGRKLKVTFPKSWTHLYGNPVTAFVF